jgi:hypothetical protein
MPLPPLTADEVANLDAPGSSANQKVAQLAEFALRRLGSQNEQTPKFSPEIREAVRELYPALFDQITDNTFNNYLNQAPGLNSKVISLGTARGYYYDSQAQARALEDPIVVAGEAEEPPALLQKEAKLYEHVKNWLVANGYRAKVVATGRQLGPWGNPDVVGIQVLDILGAWQAQTVSIEVKVSSQNWQRAIFEAISHRRYFDRCYFCYPVLANNRQVPEELKDYAELYSIGLLLIELAPAELDKLSRGLALDSSNLSITEVCPAPYAAVMPKYRKAAFSALGISDLESLFAWAGQ